MKKQIVLLFTIILLFLSTTITTFAKNSDWVLDETGTLTQETIDYIGNLNENVYSTYKNKPQLAVVIIYKLPEYTTINQYKNELFNKYGVGTKEENCGTLFVMSILDKEYAFEIGDGYKKGSLLRYMLEEDFVDSNIKELLAAGDYNNATMKIVDKIDNIMKKEESGLIAAKEKEINEQERLELIENEKAKAIFFKGFFLFLKIILFVAIFFTLLYLILYFIKKKIFVKQSLEILNKNKKAIASLGVDYSKRKKEFVFSYWNELISEKDYNIFDITHEIDILRFIYDVYVKNSKEYIDDKKFNTNKLKYKKQDYFKVLEDTNTFDDFLKGNILAIDDIIGKTNKIEETKEKTLLENKKAIESYIDSLDLITKKIDSILLKNYIEVEEQEHLYSMEEIKTIVNEKIKILESEKNKEKTILENKKNMDFYIDSLDKNTLKIDILSLKESISFEEEERVYSMEEIKSIVNEKVKILEFDFLYEKFIQENKEKINPKYFNKTSFQEQLVNHNDYKTIGNGIFNNNLLLFIILTRHMEFVEQKQLENEMRMMQQENMNIHESSNSSSDSFGSSFGGGSSSGGGFSGGW